MKRAFRSRRHSIFVYAIFSILWIGPFFAGCNSSSSGTPPDTTPPSTPTGLVVTAVSSTQINLTWMASTDNVGVTGYKVERCSGVGCSNFAQIATPTGASYSDMGLTGSTNYSYRVRATDAAGNLSTYSSASSATTAPPTFTSPSNLTATAVSSSQINLSWMAGTETGGTISQYLVERCSGLGCGSFAQIATTTNTNFSDTGLSASTSYSYRVQATDAAGNLSGFSGTSSGTTLASGGNISVSISPKGGGVVTSQTITLTARVNNDVGSAGVTWNTTGGTLTGPTLVSATFSSTTAGSFTITAKSNADTTQSASVTIGVTDLAGVFTQRYDPQRTGQNAQEYALTPNTVGSSTFGKLFACAVDAEVYAQPLYVAKLQIGGGIHNTVFVATENDSVYAFDADASPCVQFWKVSLLNGGTPVSPSDTGETGDINTIIGITGTPVIDPVSQALYVVSKTKEGTTYHQRLHALSLTDHSEKFNGPADITNALTVPGIGDVGDSTCPSTSGVPFCPLHENQRPGLLLLNGVVYIAWASHGDNSPYHGWVIGYQASNLAQPPVLFNATPDGSAGGIWQTGTGPAADSNGNIYVITGNGDFDTSIPRTNYGDSFIKLSTMGGTLSVPSFFSPSDQSTLSANDWDLGSGGPVVLPDSAGSAAHPHLLIGGDKEGKLFLIDRDNMTGFNMADMILQEVNAGNGMLCITCGIFSTPAFWQGNLYVIPIGSVLKQYSLSNAALSLTPVLQGSDLFDYPGASPAVSSTGSSNGIVWVVNTANNGTPNPGNASAPAVLFAYDAISLTNLFSSPATAGPGAAGNAVKFVVPTVANGKVYIGTQTELSVFGLLP